MTYLFDVIMDSIVSQGIRIFTKCRYLKFTLGKWIKVTEDFERSLFEITFPENLKSSELIDHRISLIKDQLLIPTDYKRIESPIIDLNGLVIKKLIQDHYVYNQFLVDNIEDFIMDFDSHRCTVLIPNKAKCDIDNYIKLLNHNPYLEIICYDNLKLIENYYNLIFSRKSVSIPSTNQFAFNTKKKYEKYILRMVDIQSSFNTQFTELLKKFGIELIRYPIAENVHAVNHIVYRITELGAQQMRKTDDEETLKYAIQHKAAIDFDASFPDIIMLTDFKNKFQNLDLVTNFTEFYTKDKLGRCWISNIKWGMISTDFEQDFSQDNFGNNAFKATFNAELYYYVVYDEVFYKIQNVILETIMNETKEDNYISIKIEI